MSSGNALALKQDYVLLNISEKGRAIKMLKKSYISRKIRSENYKNKKQQLPRKNNNIDENRYHSLSLIMHIKNIVKFNKHKEL